ncbi:MarR family transcriptional regulator [Mycobacterium sp. KBS0706]|uniref:MarR family winged helix-turn-helix transcriptional regulator n=1 Tax=Mycobacterium sp. KBS0706 TaxID=2578109 RepID=UPI00110FAEA6|nr:MarR family transcriptional regulator [Mycobacterium sp. KBS0706]TSD87857.1 MarR family transcriptional regulator [Mycobacterium sp. KBS0706]
MIDPDQTLPIEREQLSAFRLQLMALLRRLRRESDGGDIPLSQLMLLAALLRLGGTASPTELAAVEGLRSSNVAALLRGLEKDGLVRREADAGDRRRLHVVLTDAGTRAVLENRSRREAWMAEAVAACLSPEERAQLIAAGALLQRLAEYQEGGSRPTVLVPPPLAGGG